MGDLQPLCVHVQALVKYDVQVDRTRTPSLSVEITTQCGLEHQNIAGKCETARVMCPLLLLTTRSACGTLESSIYLHVLQRLQQLRGFPVGFSQQRSIQELWLVCHIGRGTLIQTGESSDLRMKILNCEQTTDV